ETFISSLREQKKMEGYKFQVQDENTHRENWAVISARYFEAQGFAEGVLFDITDQYSQMMELQRVNAELDNFIYHASHDLRSPLTSIMGLVNLGLKEPDVKVVHDYLGMIRSRIDHLDILLKDLISVSYNNGDEKQYEPFDFEEEVNSISKLLKNPDQDFKITAEVSQPCDFKTDPIRMRTILRNLISNAFKYYNPEVSTPFIHLTVRVAPTHCAILLKDNGIGIHQAFKNKVFNMFFRATERSAGSGLGLYIVKSMVEKLKGRISFESTLNVGTTFLLTVPNETAPNVIFKITDPTNYFMITSKQIELVENSWDYVLLNSQETGATFYKKLFSVDPSLRQLFKGDINMQSQKLVAMITFAVHKLNNLDEIVADVKALGIQHKKNLVEINHYETVGAVLLWTLEKALGREWNEEVKDAWTAVYTTLSKTMIEATK
ncbi:MAG TPA: ATP-binding protein, partial [Cyclobacteriaceae bacterium]|nr:ATP-binding protein [Cyclobacteriaceae bacterium]